MEKKKHILTVLYSNEGSERIVQGIMMKHLECDLKGASCAGMMSINRFSATDDEAEKVVNELKDEHINFILVKDDNAKFQFNRKLGLLFSDEEHEEVSLKKKSLEDQLKDAVGEQNFLAAAAIRDKINKSKKPVPPAIEILEEGEVPKAKSRRNKTSK